MSLARAKLPDAHRARSPPGSLHGRSYVASGSSGMAGFAGDAEGQPKRRRLAADSVGGIIARAGGDDWRCETSSTVKRV